MEQLVEILQFIQRTQSVVRKYPQRFLQQTNNELMRNYPDIHRDLQRHYYAVFKEKIESTGCGSCFLDKFMELKSLKISQMAEKIQIQSRLKDGIVVQMDGEYYSNRSPHLTNEICDEIYKKYGASYFDYYKHTVSAKPDAEFGENITADDVQNFFHKVPPTNDQLNEAIKQVEPEKPKKEKKPRKPRQPKAEKQPNTKKA
jgi:hypothetical protein